MSARDEGETREDGPEKSPDLLKKSSGAMGSVRRLNKVPLAIGGAVLTTLLGVVGYTAVKRGQEMRPTGGDPSIALRGTEKANAGELLSELPEGGVVEAKGVQKGLSEVRPVEQATVIRGEPVFRSGASEQRQQENDQMRQARFAAWQSAVSAPTAVPGGVVKTAAQVAEGKTEPANVPIELAKLAAQGRQQPTGDDQNKQSEKKEFLQQEAAADHYLRTGRTAPLSPYEVKQGAVIPAVLVSGINSDLPGQIVAQVSQNVWDTATGRYLLIPQGAKLVGTYDSMVTWGQERVLVAWTRIIYPDASTLDLGLMPGADQGGYAGFNDQVNNHYWRIFGSAILMSLFSAGAQLSQPQATVGEGYSAQQIAAASMGQQLSNVGSQLAQRNMGIQPTLEIRPGYRFLVMVTKDMIVRPWQG